MQKATITFALAAAVCLPGWISAQNQQPAEQKTTGAQDNSTQARQFVERAAQIHMTQAHLGDMAHNQAGSEEVKQLGKRIADEHRQAYQKLGRLAAQFAFTVPKAIDSEHQAIIRRFEKLSSSEFDQEFKRHQTRTLQEGAGWYKQQAENIQNSELKQYATDMSSKLRDDQQRAQNIHLTMTGTGDRMTADREVTAGPVPAGQAGGALREQLDVSEELYGTVARFEKGKHLEVKVRNRIGRHSYDLSASDMTIEIPNDLSVGTQVKVMERIDANGYRTLQVTTENARPHSADRVGEQNKTGK